jgi:asparaginyl-tRNA synthetase
LERVEISKLYRKNNLYENKTNEITVCGWVRSLRCSKKIGFIDLNDGSCISSLQVVFKDKLKNFEEISHIGVGACISVLGVLVSTPLAAQLFEFHATSISIKGASTSDYPLQKKKHSLEYMRTIAHLRARTNTFSSIFRIRSSASYAIHKFLQEDDFNYIHTPIITGNDAEGAGEAFSVTSFDLKNEKLKKFDFSKDFFGKHVMLTVSGQLQAECMATALSKVYTFAPTFRAENSNTQRHAAEFWMLEPEIAFANLNDIINLASRLIKYIVKHVLNFCEKDLEFLNKTYDEKLLIRLENILQTDFDVITYTQAINILEDSENNFEYEVSWGKDLQSEHERYLTEKIFKKPIFVIDYPKNIKAFYMRQNDDEKTVAAMDMLFPGIGEMIGGSQREERLDLLLKRIKELNLKKEDYWWYLELRKYGTVEHSGFGLGFERLLMFLTSFSNIRDVMPFPRTVKNAEF